MNQKTPEQLETGKVDRVPFSANRQRLQVDEQFDGYVTRWFNDQDDRVQRAVAAGYEFVHRKDVKNVGTKDVANGNTDVNSRVSRVVGRTRNEQPIRAYLMKIKREFYEQDQRSKARINDRVDEAIKAGKPGGTEVEEKYGSVTLQRNDTL